MKKHSIEIELLKKVDLSVHERPVRLLMVEDDADYRTFVKRLIIQKGQPEFEFIGVGSLQQCRQFLTEEVVDVILLDLTLPDSGGVGLISTVSELCHGAPIIVLTGREDTNIGLVAVSMGAQDYLIKHRISNDGLIRCIRYSIERKKFEESRFRLAAIRDFIATLAHDLQVPLVGSNNVFEALLEGSFGSLSTKQIHVLNSLKNSNREQLAVVQKLLELYKYEVDSPNLNFQPVDISKLIVERAEELAAANSKSIQIDVQQSLPLILGDRQALTRLLDNLLLNAIQFGEPNTPVRVWTESNAKKLSIHIHNLGPPLPEELRGGSFEKFWQGVPGKSYVAHTGIGLFLCHRIASLHRGTLIATSSESEGTTMTVNLPTQTQP